MATTAVSAIWFLILTLPICIWVAWNDMKFMKIPNKAVLAMIAVFVVVGPFVLELPEYAWRYLHFVAILAIGFILNMIGAVGAGDAKFAASMAPLVAQGDVQVFVFLFLGVLLAAFVTHRLFKRLPPFRRLTSDWKSWTHNDFPMGLTLAGTMTFFLMIASIYGA